MTLQTQQCPIPPTWTDNRNDMFPGEMLVRVLFAVDDKGVFWVLDVVREG